MEGFRRPGQEVPVTRVTFSREPYQALVEFEDGSTDRLLGLDAGEVQVQLDEIVRRTRRERWYRQRAALRPRPPEGRDDPEHRLAM